MYKSLTDEEAILISKRSQLEQDLIAFIRIHPHQFNIGQITKHFITNCYNGKDIHKALWALLDAEWINLDIDWKFYFLEEPLPYAGQG